MCNNQLPFEAMEELYAHESHLGIWIHESSFVETFLFSDFKCRFFVFHDAPSNRNVIFLIVDEEFKQFDRNVDK